MPKKKIFLTVQALLCVLIAAVLAVFAVRTYIEGSAWQAAGHPADWIYTREKAGRALFVVLPLFLLSVVMTVTGLVKGIREEEADRPVALPASARAGSGIHNTAPETARRRILVRRILMAAAVVFIVLGIFNGSMKDVLVKAVRICTECVGLG